jgi:hypothetical protein
MIKEQCDNCGQYTVQGTANTVFVLVPSAGMMLGFCSYECLKQWVTKRIDDYYKRVVDDMGEEG